MCHDTKIEVVLKDKLFQHDWWVYIYRQSVYTIYT